MWPAEQVPFPTPSDAAAAGQAPAADDPRTRRTADAASILGTCLAGSDPAWFGCFFSLLGDPTRLRILQLLERDGELNVQALCAALGLPQPTVSHHLGLLRRAGVLRSRRDGKRIYYALDPQFGPAPLRLAT